MDAGFDGSCTRKHSREIITEPAKGAPREKGKAWPENDAGLALDLLRGTGMGGGAKNRNRRLLDDQLNGMDLFQIQGFLI